MFYLVQLIETGIEPKIKFFKSKNKKPNQKIGLIVN